MVPASSMSAFRVKLVLTAFSAKGNPVSKTGAVVSASFFEGDFDSLKVVAGDLSSIDKVEGVSVIERFSDNIIAFGF